MKAKKLSLKDKGKISSNKKDKVVHPECGQDIRLGESFTLITKKFFHWCPGCNKILYEVH